MLGGGVDTAAQAQGRHPADELIRAASREVVSVQHGGAAGQHRPGLAPSALQLPQDVPADILKVILLGFGEGLIGLNGGGIAWAACFTVSHSGVMVVSAMVNPPPAVRRVHSSVPRPKPGGLRTGQSRRCSVC